MENNMGSKERGMRLGAGAVLVLLGLFMSKWLLLLGLILLATGYFSFCPAWKVLGKNPFGNQ